MTHEGFNPMRWNCSKQGCFNIKKRPKIEVFHDLFKAGVNFGDVDGIVEVNHRLLVLEWKPHPIDLPTGQSKMYLRVTKGKLITVFCVAGDPEAMTVSHVAKFKDGVWCDWESANLERLRSMIRSWKNWAGFNPGIWQ